MDFTIDDLKALFAAFAARMRAERDALCALDGVIGDADHGIAMEQGMNAAAEAVNTQMAAECYQIPLSWTLWGTPHAPKLQGLGDFVFPDGSQARDGAGFSGSFWVNALWIDPDLA